MLTMKSQETKRTPLSFLISPEKNFMTQSIVRFLVLITLLASLVSTARAGAIIEGEPTDAMVTQSAINNAAYSTGESDQIGMLYSWLGADVSNMIEPFALPYLAPG